MYINLLTQLKNAQAVKKENIKIGYSKMDEEIVKILATNNYIESFEKKGRGIKKVLNVNIKYLDGKGVINGVKLISKPSRQIYLGYKEIKPVKHGYGLMVISTPSGIMTAKDARKQKIGGMALFEIW